MVRGPDSDPYRISILIGHIYNLGTGTVRIRIRHYKKVRDQDEDIVETGNDLYNTAVRLRLILFSKDIGAF